MKKYKDIQIAEAQCVEHTCDLCGNKIGAYNDSEGEFHTYWARWPEESSETDYMDVCIDCYVDKIKPILLKLGVIFYSDYDKTETND